jgi:hypothetical protein
LSLTASLARRNPSGIEAFCPSGGPTDLPAATGERHSRLGGAVVSLGVIAVGVLGVVDLAGARIPGSGYGAVPLTVVGLGLVFGACRHGQGPRRGQ